MKNKLHMGRGGVGKIPVLGFRERGGRSIAFPVEGTTMKRLHAEVHAHVERGSTLCTDEYAGYNGLDLHYERSTVNHGRGFYVDDEDDIEGHGHVNSVESMWALFRRSIRGTWHKVSSKHLARYCNEVTFRPNGGSAKEPVWNRMQVIAVLMFRTRITYKQLVAG